MPTLDWITRGADVTAHARVPYRMLDAAPALDVGVRDPSNMLIQGDNLDALKALLPIYAGRVKCIYIDPPYNTRSAFEHYDDNLEHAQWLAMPTDYSVTKLAGKSVEKVLTDDRLRWPDTFSEGPDGTMYLTASHIQDTQWFTPGAPPSIKTELFSIDPN